jgi:hypothetical protein
MSLRPSPGLHVLALGLSLVLAVSLAPPSRPADATVAQHADPATRWTATELSTDEEAVVAWAYDRYAAAGLTLPAVEVVAHPTTDPCLGRAGAHTVVDGRSVIHLCRRLERPLAEFLLLHELGHAWDAAALPPARRAAFLAVRGLEEWRNDDPERWDERGAEHAAEILVWGLMDRPVRLIQIPRTSCAELLVAYLVLTGRVPADPVERCSMTSGS